MGEKLKLSKEQIEGYAIKGALAAKAAPGSIYFKRFPEMPETRCRNADRVDKESVCDVLTKPGFTLCEGCREALK